MPFLNDLTRSPAKAIALAVIHLAILVTGMAIGSAKYNDWDFAARYVPTLAAATALMASVTVLMGFSRREIGLRAPKIVNVKWLIPGLAIVLAGALSFALTWMSLPEGATIDSATMARTFLATGMVGFTEEWMYRGLILVVMIRWLDFRNGSLVAAAAFGLFHIGNLVAGAPLASTLQQVVFTTLIGLTFFLMALATRSLIPAMIAHALYDFFLLATSQLEEAGAEPSLVAGLATMIAGLAAVVIAVRHLNRATTTDPYQVTASQNAS